MHHNCFQIDHDESYRQLHDLSPRFPSADDFRLNLLQKTPQFYLIFFVFLILTSQSNGLPVAQPMTVTNNQFVRYVYVPIVSTPAVLPVVTIRLTDQSNDIPSSDSSLNQMKVYRHYAASKSNPQSAYINEQLRRERQRRVMIDRMLNLFDEDGNGQLTSDELYSMALRSNMFPKIHYYLKQPLQ